MTTEKLEKANALQKQINGLECSVRNLKEILSEDLDRLEVRLEVNGTHAYVPSEDSEAICKMALNSVKVKLAKVKKEFSDL